MIYPFLKGVGLDIDGGISLAVEVAVCVCRFGGGDGSRQVSVVAR